jgi:hypothetical protein
MPGSQTGEHRSIKFGRSALPGKRPGDDAPLEYFSCFLSAKKKTGFKPPPERTVHYFLDRISKSCMFNYS